MITILNTSILTAYGSYTYEPIKPIDIGAFLENQEIQSAVGHASTAEILTVLLGFKVPVNRIDYSQGVGDQALVFKLKKRAPEGVILSKFEIEEIGYEFGVLTRTA